MKKNRIFIRTLLVFYVLIALVIASVILLCVWYVIPPTTVFYWFDSMYNNSLIVIIASIVGVLMVVLSFVLLFSRLDSKSDESQVIKESTFGSISITILALEEIAKRYFNEIKEVRTLRLAATTAKVGINIKIYASLAPQVVIPVITDKVQGELKEVMENFTGIVINHIDLIVCDSTLTSR